MTAERPLPRLYAIVDVDVCARVGRPPLDVARAYLAGGARLLQLRAKAMGSGAMLDVARQMAELARRAGARVIVNDRADLACLAGADGVHVGQDDLPPQEVRRLLGAEAIVGVSTHTPAQCEQALAEPVSYLAVGPVFGTATKNTGYEAVGLTAVADAARRAAAGGLPVVAIGGITLATARSVLDAGAASIAVITDLLVGDPEARVRDFLAAVEP